MNEARDMLTLEELRALAKRIILSLSDDELDAVITILETENQGT